MDKYLKVLPLLIVPLFLISTAIANDDGFVFSHKYHKEMGIDDCTTCHTTVTQSTSGTDDLIPGAEVCQMCHGDEVTPPTNIPRITDYQKIFSHKKHVEGESIDCLTCHSSVEESDTVSMADLPTMNDCFTCHASDVKQVPEDCRMCHGPNERLTPLTHTATWKNYHGMVANDAADQECSTCHVSESFCQECHFGDNVTQESHPVNWEYTHGVEARQQSSDCSTCHESKQFCADCHTQNLVMPVTHASPDWAVARTGGRHAMEAEMDIDNCVVCHTSPETDPTCLDCHSK